MSADNLDPLLFEKRDHLSQEGVIALLHRRQEPGRTAIMTSSNADGSIAGRANDPAKTRRVTCASLRAAKTLPSFSIGCSTVPRPN